MNHASPSTRSLLRSDIQMLRGYAVLSVLIYHANLGLLPAGYLGVDVFFVISGFLITRMIGASMARGDFSFRAFFFRRAKRLLPAAYVTFFATTVIAPWWLTSSELADLWEQLLGALTFTANFVLLDQSDYFSGEAALKPLLHVWSLSVEEQYYALLPLTLWLLPKRHWLRACLIIIGVSLLITFLFPGRDSSFFLLHARAWELGLGSLGALVALNSHQRTWINRLFWPSIGALAWLVAWPLGSFHPGIDAVIVCVATLIIILRAHPVRQINAAGKGLAHVGNFSYSLYLVHWPLFAFYNNAWVADPATAVPIAWSLALLSASLVLGYLLYRLVEAPAHYARVTRPRRYLAALLLTPLVLIGASFGAMQFAHQDKAYDHIRRANFGLDAACDFRGDFTPLEKCRNSPEPEVLVWGDSIAMHTVPAIALPGSDVPLVQATKSQCGPLLGLALYTDEGRNTGSWGESCIAFNHSVITYLKEAPSITTVVLSSSFSYYLAPDGKVLAEGTGGGGVTVLPARESVALQALQRTIRAIRQTGKRVVIVAPPPTTGQNPSRCVERFERGLPAFGDRRDCHLDASRYHNMKRAVKRFLAAASTASEVHVIELDEWLCDDRRCFTHCEGTVLYRDAAHLSYEGAEWLGRQMQLPTLIREFSK